MNHKITTTNIAIKRTDGSVSIMAFLTLGRGHILPKGGIWISRAEGWWGRPATRENVEEEIARACEPGTVAGWRPMALGEAPTDRTYRDAWVDAGDKIVHDMPKAREIHRNRIRVEREGAMRKLDGEWMRATGKSNKAEADAIEAKRQVWRDAPADPRIDAAKTVEELKALQAPE